MRLNLLERFVEKTLKNSTLKWNMQVLSSLPTISTNFIEKHIDWKWDLRELSMNTAITPDFLEKYPDGFCGQKGICLIFL